MKIIKDNFKDRKVNNLLKKHFLELREVSPKGSTHVLDIEGLQHKNIKFWSIWENNKLIGCGALKILSKHHGEFKSIRVNDEFRKKGRGKSIIYSLIEEARKIQIKTISVETGAGDFFLPARKLFKSCGFQICKPFAHYLDDPNSKYYKLDI